MVEAVKTSQDNLPTPPAHKPKREDRLIEKGVDVLYGIYAIGAGFTGGSVGLLAGSVAGGPVGGIIGAPIGFYVGSMSVTLVGKVTKAFVRTILDAVEYTASLAYRGTVFTVKAPFVATYYAGKGVASGVHKVYQSVFPAQK